MEKDPIGPLNRGVEIGDPNLRERDSNPQLGE